MSTFTARLSRYAALAAALPAATADAGITYQQNLNIVVDGGQTAFIDFGPGFGEVFRFEARRSSYDYGSAFEGLFQFNPNNGNGISRGGFVAGLYQTYGGSGGFTYNDPARLNFLDPIGSTQRFYESMSTSFGAAHDLAFGYAYSARSVAVQDAFYNWLPDARGFIGFKMVKDGTFHFGWIDVETRNWSGDGGDRSGPQIIIHGWGFQDKPRVWINAGEIPAPAAGGLIALALGAAGVRRARRIAH